MIRITFKFQNVKLDTDYSNNTKPFVIKRDYSSRIEWWIVGNWFLVALL